ncbi:MAG: hypothetical protein LBB53_03345 [Prevotellaceae bacterium]|jgi:hypothetical protein|nr:hypothetical protein [Prevotellaceae bacterium]
MLLLSLRQFLIGYGIFIVISYISVFSFKYFQKIKDENQRLRANVSILQSEIKFYESTDKKNSSGKRKSGLMVKY